MGTIPLVEGEVVWINPLFITLHDEITPSLSPTFLPSYTSMEASAEVLSRTPLPRT